MSKISELVANTDFAQADDIMAIINDPGAAHTAKRLVLERLAAVTAGLTNATAADLDDDDLAMLIDDPTGSPAAKKITLAELGNIAQNATLQLYPTDRWYVEAQPRHSTSIGSCFTLSGNTYTSAGGYTNISSPDAYGHYTRFNGPSTLSYSRMGNASGSNFRYLYCANTKFYAQWRVRALRNTNTFLWFIYLDEITAAPASWVPATGLLGVPIIGFTFAHNSGTMTDTNWQTIMGDAGTNVRVDTGVALDLVAPQLLEVESNDDFTSVEFRIDGAVVDTRNSGFPTSGLGHIMLAQAIGAGNGGWDFYGYKHWRVPHNGLWPECEP